MTVAKQKNCTYNFQIFRSAIHIQKLQSFGFSKKNGSFRCLNFKLFNNVHKMEVKIWHFLVMVAFSCLPVYILNQKYGSVSTSIRYVLEFNTYIAVIQLWIGSAHSCLECVLIERKCAKEMDSEFIKCCQQTTNFHKNLQPLKKTF